MPPLGWTRIRSARYSAGRETKPVCAGTVDCASQRQNTTAARMRSAFRFEKGKYPGIRLRDYSSRNPATEQVSLCELRVNSPSGVAADRSCFSVGPQVNLACI